MRYGRMLPSRFAFFCGATLLTAPDLERKAPPLPMPIDTRLYLRFHEVPYTVQEILLVVVEQRLQCVEVGAAGSGRGAHRRSSVRLISESLNHRRQFGSVGDQVDVAAGMLVHRRMRQQPRHELGVCHWYDGIVAPRDDQRPLPDQR